jgi:hypothetical protein
MIRRLAASGYTRYNSGMFFIPSWAVGVVVIVFAVALARRIRFPREPRGGRSPGISEVEAGELRQELDAMQQRVGELEERVDFAERLLAKHRESDRLSPPQ